MARHKNKVTWADVYEEFRSRHPRLSKQVLRYEPYDFATILLIFFDRSRMTYNCDTKALERLNSEEY